MKKKSKIILIIFFAIVGLLLILNYFYYENKKDDYLECTLLKNKYSNYQEKLTFRFISGTLYTYNREETISSDNINEDYKTFEGIKKEAPDYPFFKYDISKNGNIIKVSTAIEAFYMYDYESSIAFYNDYISELGLDYSDTLDEVKQKLESDYSCRKYRK